MTREYGQFCGLSHALDLIGGRWTLLIIRELLTGPKRYTDLEQGLPGIPTNILSTRMRELEESGLVERKVMPRPATGIVYVLTDYGRELEAPLLQLGLWGAQSLGAPKPGEFISPATLALGLRAMFQPDAAQDADLTFEIVIGEEALRGSIANGQLTVPASTAARPDLSIASEPAVLTSLFRGQQRVDDAMGMGALQIQGSPDHARRFFDLFHMP